MKKDNYRINNNYNIGEKINYIIAEINIGDDDINKKIRIINSFEESKRNIDSFNGKFEEQYYNEEEIKQL